MIKIKINEIPRKNNSRSFPVKIQKIIFALIVCTILLTLSSTLLASVPRLISYQGKATDASGNPVPDADYQVRFYLYDHPTAGTALWMEAFFTIHTTNGLFTHLLGSNNPLPDSLFSNYDSLYLAVMFNFEWQTPRTPLATSGYAFRVNSVDGATGGIIDGNVSLNNGGFSCTLPDTGQGELIGYNAVVGESMPYPNTYGFKSDVTGAFGQWAYGIYAAVHGTGVGYVAYFDAQNETYYAGYFDGRVHVNGNLSKSSGSFLIDHPLEPENKYLQHSFVESPDMMNIYNGNVTTDADGKAIVPLPGYFSALNQDFRYQLTVIGQFAQAIIAEEISDNRFSIETDKPNVKVSWQVTGVRKDNWANAHRIQVEIEKSADERGKYLHPEEFGQPVEKSMNWEQRNGSQDSGKKQETGQ